MLACVSPSENDMHETLTTLQYAYRARAVQNKVSYIFHLVTLLITLND